jgi:ribonuclease E
MAKEICISSTPHETRLAILEDDQLAEIYYERENEYTLAGSIYNGRVTRVLPGMQSAFVDLGLERDAFLYVTDFIELEDQEETDELEKAAASGAGQPPREVRHSNGAERGRYGREPRGRQSESRPERHNADLVIEPETTPEPADAVPLAQDLPAARIESQEFQEDAGGAGGRRWRGRRHRRGRGPGSREEGRAETALAAETAPEAAPEPAIASDIHAAAHTDAGPPAPQRHSPRAPRAEASPAPFVLPGESLSKYGATPADDGPKLTEKPAPSARQSSFSKPSTLIEAPIEWDGSGLLPGESISRHRRTQPEAAPEPVAEILPEPQAAEPEFTDEHSEPEAIAETAETDLFPELEEDLPVEEAPAFEPEPESELVASAAPPEDKAPAAHEGPQGRPFEAAAEEEAPAFLATTEDVPAAAIDEMRTSVSHAGEEAGPEADASASHRVDPIPPTGFRLFGLGGKKKKEEPQEFEEPSAAASVAAVSAFAPGEGTVEEELIEGEEYESAPHHRQQKSDEGDLDDYEEETLAAQIRSGGLGEMLQEAHLDHKIQMTFDEKNGDDEAVDVEDDEEEEPSSETQPPSGQPRNDRGGRGRRGRGPQTHGNRRGGPSRRSMQTTDLPVISDLLKPGQEILVQIAKEPIAKKGARITSHIALPGRFLVFMPTVTHVGVSRKIASDEERHRLKRILLHERGEASGGFIVRTAADGATEEDLRADLRFLINLWNEIKQRSEASKSPALIYHDLSLIERILRDQVSANFSNIWVDSEADYERIVRFLNRFSPSLVRRVKLYTKDTPLFEHFGIQDEISKALRSKVWLKSGGSIVINQTEALVAIDINTGKYVGKSARLEDTIVKTNLDAVPEIVRQIRLRDLGGIIVIDFIDMDDRKNRYRVLAALEEALKSDRAPTKVLQFNDFGLVAITRKRVKQSLERTLSVPCPTCQATGMVKSPATVANEIYTEMRKMRKHFEGQDVMLRVHPETVKVLKSNNARWLNEFEELIGKNLLVKSDPTLHPEQFDIQG